MVIDENGRNEFKPGMLEMVRQFLYFNPYDSLCRIEGAKKVSNFCNMIMGVKEIMGEEK